MVLCFFHSQLLEDSSLASCLSAGEILYEPHVESMELWHYSPAKVATSFTNWYQHARSQLWQEAQGEESIRQPSLNLSFDPGASLSECLLFPFLKQGHSRAKNRRLVPHWCVQVTLLDRLGP